MEGLSVSRASHAASMMVESFSVAMRAKMVEASGRRKRDEGGLPFPSKIAGPVVKQRDAIGRASCVRENRLVGGASRFRHIPERADIQNLVEEVADSQTRQDFASELSAIVCENEPASRQALKGRTQFGVRFERQRFDVVDLRMISVGVHAMMLHHACQRDTVVTQIFLLDREGFVARQAQVALHEAADAVFDVLRGRRIQPIERVVEVEDPGLDVPEIWPWRHDLLRGDQRAGAVLGE